jgi:RHS repeat-associated protein
VVYQGSAAQGSSANNFAYDGAGDPTTISEHDSTGNFDTYTQSFDNDGEVTGQTPMTGSGGSSSTYGYNTLGDQTEAVTGSITTTDTYNQLGQLTSATTPSTSASYLYDGGGLEAQDQSYSQHWGTPAAVDSTRSLQSVSCPTTSFCTAVDSAGDVLTSTATTWSAPSDIDGSYALEAVSCASSSSCVAVDDNGQALSYNGSSWSSATSIDSTRTVNAISCPTSSFCAAVDNSGYAVIFSGGSWGSPSHIDGSNALESVSCVSSSFCMATDDDGNALTYNGSSWSSAISVDSSRTVEGVSCTSTNFCAAVDTSGYATVYSGSAWSTPSDIDGSDSFESVSCASFSYCAATDDDGNVLTYNGGVWSSSEDIDGARTLSSVSCAATGICVAVDTSGYAALDNWSTRAVQLTWDDNSSLGLLLSDGTYDYVYGPSSAPVEQVSLGTSAATFMTYTQANSTWLTTNAAGEETGFWGYDAFGDLAFGSPTSAFGYAAQYADPTTGLSDMRARWYDPGTAEFTSVDPDVAETGQPYVYAGDDPVNEGDPSGMRPYRPCDVTGVTVFSAPLPSPLQLSQPVAPPIEPSQPTPLLATFQQSVGSPSACAVRIDEPHMSSTRVLLSTNVHANIACSAPVDQLTLWVALDKVGCWGFCLHTVNPGAPVSNFGQASLQDNDTAAVCKNTKETTWVGVVKLATAIENGVPYAANGPGYSESFTWSCGT